MITIFLNSHSEGLEFSPSDGEISPVDPSAVTRGADKIVNRIEISGSDKEYLNHLFDQIPVSKSDPVIYRGWIAQFILDNI